MGNNLNLVDADALAKFFRREIRTIQHWAQVEGMPKEETGLYDFVKCARWRLDQVEEQLEEAKKGDATLYKLKQEYQKMLNQEKEITLKKLNETLIDKNDVNFVITSMIKMLMNNAEAIPPRLTKKLNGDSIMLAIIKNEIRDFRLLCANTPMQFYEDEYKKFKEPNEDEKEFIDRDENNA